MSRKTKLFIDIPDQCERSGSVIPKRVIKLGKALAILGAIGGLGYAIEASSIPLLVSNMQTINDLNYRLAQRSGKYLLIESKLEQSYKDNLSLKVELEQYSNKYASIRESHAAQLNKVQSEENFLNQEIIRLNAELSTLTYKLTEEQQYQDIFKKELVESKLVIEALRNEIDWMNELCIN